MKRKYVWVVALLPLLWFLPLIGVRVQAQADEPTVTVPAPLKLNCYPVYDDSHSELILNDGRHLAVCSPNEATPVPPTETSVPPTETAAPPTPTSKVPPTLPPPTDPPPTSTGPIAPFAGAPACEHPANSFFHSLWNDQQGCHYDHEHGTDPFTAQVAAAFPGFDLKALLGNVEIGHTNPSSEMENTHKHGGMKWDIAVPAPQGCVLGFESAGIGVDAAAIQYHAFGRYDVEMETSIHSTAALIRQCDLSGDHGYIYVVSWQEYGERCAPYQGETVPYPNSFQPPYDCAFGQYFTVECVDGPVGSACGRSRAEVIGRDSSSIWTSKKTGNGVRPTGSGLFNLLFRVRDVYQVFVRSDFTYPFTFLWLCSADGGQTYDPNGCRYNNSATAVHEVAGTLPAEWDGAAFDHDPRPGRVTGEFFVDRYGAANPACAAPGPDCFPIKLVAAWVGVKYGGELSAEKVSNDTPANTPDRDIYFCGQAVCSETAPGAVPSGWIGANN